MFADAAGWARPIWFAHGVGGHAAALTVAEQTRVQHVGRLVFAHIGRPTIRAIDAGQKAPFGEFGADGASYTLTPANSSRSDPRRMRSGNARSGTPRPRPGLAAAFPP